jgi:epoxyqueuosine reductase
MQLISDLTQKAQQLGFSGVGITLPNINVEFEYYLNWLDEHYHAEMHYLASERGITARQNPASLLENCQSILVLATHYYQGAWPTPPENTPAGKVARYAWNDDYHDVLKSRCQQLVGWLREQVSTPFQAKIYVDTGPLLERALGQQAGLGWVGKNSMLISPTLGSFFLLSEILLDIALPTHSPFATDHCGTCTRCIDACPTQAILPSQRSIDAKRCISYQTIENKNDIPAELAPSLSGWLFGCDICQDVCPWNRFAQPTTDPAFLPRTSSGIPNIPLQDLLSQSAESYQQAFRHSPLKRAKQAGLVRNAKNLLTNQE